MKTRAVVLLLCCVQMAAICAGSDGEYDPRDGLAPKTSKDEALALPLAAATIVTASLEETVLFYCDGMGLTLEGPIEQSAAEVAAQKALWGVEEEIGWKLYRLHRPATTGEIMIRLLVLDRPTPTILSSWEPRQSGPFSLGFPTSDGEQQDQRLRDLGFGARNELEKYTIPRTDGSRYPIHETIFNAPDFVHAVNILRGGGMAPLGPIDPETGRGGPGYSAWVARDSQPVLDFFTEVLGLELRTDYDFPSGSPDGAMRNQPGTVFRFSILFAKGYGPGGHLLVIDFKDGPEYPPNAEPRVPNRGLGMWTFPVTDLDQVMENAHETGATIVHEPVEVNAPVLGGTVRAATLLAPEGILVEVYQADVE